MAAQSSEEAIGLRAQLKELEQSLKQIRSELDELRENRGAQTARSAKLAVELEYMEAACVSDLGTEAAGTSYR